MPKRWRYFLYVATLAVGAPAVAVEGDIERLVEQNEASVIIIVGTRRSNGAEVQSSGCCVHGSGYVLTTAHQVAGVEQLQGRLVDGSVYPLSLVEVDQAREIALLKAPGPFVRTVRLGDAATLKSGALLIAIAAPNNLDFSTVTGTVSSTNRVYHDYPAIQAQLPAAPGSSGGPVFDRTGFLVGLIIGKKPGEEWLTVVNPINNAYGILEKYGIYRSPAVPQAQESYELVPAPGISEVERHAIEAYNRGVRALAPAEKAVAYGLAITLLPEFFEAWFNLAVAETASGNLDGAQRAYREAEALRPKAVHVQRNLGRLFRRHQRYPEAAACFERALELAPSSPQSYNDVGETYRQLKRFDEAVRAFQRGLELDPGYAKARFNLALTYYNQGRPREAIEQFEAYLAQSPEAGDADEVQRWIEQLRKQAQGT